MPDATRDLSNVQCCADIERFEDERVVLTDGKTITGIDTVIFCTGYQYDFPFLSKSLLHHDGFQLTSCIETCCMLITPHSHLWGFLADYSVSFV